MGAQIRIASEMVSFPQTSLKIFLRKFVRKCRPGIVTCQHRCRVSSPLARYHSCPNHSPPNHLPAISHPSSSPTPPGLTPTTISRLFAYSSPGIPREYQAYRLVVARLQEPHASVAGHAAPHLGAQVSVTSSASLARFLEECRERRRATGGIRPSPPNATWRVRVNTLGSQLGLGGFG